MAARTSRGAVGRSGAGQRPDRDEETPGRVGATRGARLGGGLGRRIAAAASPSAAAPSRVHVRRPARRGGPRTAPGGRRCAAFEPTGRGSSRRSTASPRTPRAAGPRCRRSVPRPARATRSRAGASAIGSSIGEQRPLVLAHRELRERELVIPAQELAVRLAEHVVDRRGELGPADEREGRVEDDRHPKVEAAATVEHEIPAGDPIALGLDRRARVPGRRASARRRPGAARVRRGRRKAWPAESSQFGRPPLRGAYRATPPTNERSGTSLRRGLG